jgi:hypothetical protein
MAGRIVDQPFGAARQYQVLSDLIGRIEVRCALCQRHGLYRVDRLLALVGDVSVPQAMTEIAKRAGCHRALNPPDVGDVHYAMSVCKITRVARR